MDDLTTRDQRMMQAVLTMVITADTKEQLEADTDAIRSLSGQRMCQMAVLKYQHNSVQLCIQPAPGSPDCLIRRFFPLHWHFHEP